MPVVALITKADGDDSLPKKAVPVRLSTAENYWRGDRAQVTKVASARRH